MNKTLDAKEMSEMLKLHVKNGDYKKAKELLDIVFDNGTSLAIEELFSPTDPVNFAIDNHQENLAILFVEHGFSTSTVYKLGDKLCDQWCYNDHGCTKCPSEYDSLDNATAKKMRKLRDVILSVQEGRLKVRVDLNHVNGNKRFISPKSHNLNHSVLGLLKHGDSAGTAANEACLMFANHGANFVTKGGNTMLHKCIDKTSAHIYVLANKGVPVNIQNRDGDTALHLATRAGNFDTAEALLQCSADLSIRNMLGQCPIDEAEGPLKDLITRFMPGAVSAVLESKPQALDRLLRHLWVGLATVVKDGKTLYQLAEERAENSLEAASCFRMIQEFKNTNDLIHAVLANNVQRLSVVLLRGKYCNVNVKYRDRFGKMLLSQAIDNNNLTMVQALLQAGASVNKVRVRELEKDDKTVPLFHRTLKKGLNTDIAKLIHSVQNKSEVLEKDYNGNTAIIRAIEGGADPHVVNWLLTHQNGLCVIHRNQHGQTCREVAEILGRHDIVEIIDKFIIRQTKKMFLVNLPVTFYGKQNLQIKDETGKSLTEIVEVDGDKDDIKSLRHYTDIEKRGIALFEAAARGNMEQVVKLNEANYQDKNGYTALIRAIVFNQVSVVKFLCTSRLILKFIPDNCNRYPLHYACSLSRDQAVVLEQILLETDAEDLEQRVDKDGKFPVDYKQDCDCPAVLQMLFDARTLDAYGKRGPPLSAWPPGAMTTPPR